MSEEDKQPLHDYFDVIKMVKVSCGDLLVGLVVGETDTTLELAWPLQITFQYAKVNGIAVPIMFMTRYASGVLHEFVTLQKGQFIFCNDTDEDLDEYYYSTVEKIYKRAALESLPAEVKEQAEKEYSDPFKDTPEIDAEVDARTIAEPAQNIVHLMNVVLGKTGSKHQ